ncbi:putative membrane protein YfcA [Sphingomonas kyeonggiensis]|uniref:TSUP family transporter n=1 Tax=Sphingomonas kyeonggiensis TaxID=1268553 RepID=UPI00278AD70C|nr:TSUP family transporter [Sphingomonas kyeonggiensis]MDQ0249166.1 putative membrane protein YfcA [Sphingomonas kyeonggiensis]
MHLTPDILAFLVSMALLAGTIDAMAGGGGLISIPALMAVGIPPVSAIATNKLQSACGTASAVFAYARAGHVDWRRFALPALGAFLGAAAGATTLQFIDPGFLAAFVPVLLILMGLYFLLAPKMSEADRHARIGTIGLTLIVSGIGFYDGFFGPGTGSFLTTVLVALAGLGLVRAIGNAKFLNLSTNIAGVLAMVAGGKMLWGLAIAMAAANIVGNQIGARLAIRFGGRGVRPLLVLLSVALTAKLLADPKNPIWGWF